ncbi:CDP-alcohol phosphatidyltransferase [Novymonas esmeraldas]|uniref:CDP-alcohol phosphatidyltransferase n=1 Tax=Novymonas esmeraldas TaxID=1808958 RepID=A0AAW0ETD3_9TRYP
MFSYLPSDAKERLARYVYSGEDRSYIYKYVWCPLCRAAVRRLPVWLAPNVITVAALVFVSITHTLLAYHMPKLTVLGSDYIARSELSKTALPFAHEFLPPPPGYVFVLAAAALFLYQFLDNLDGHQARRTRTSSPLGLLMDHGCDALNCVVGSLSVAAAVSAGPGWRTWLVVLNAVVVFFMNTWEEFYRGSLVLPVVNGPNEGILIAICIYMWTAWVGGPQWWANNAVEVSSRWLPQVLHQPAPQAAVAVEAALLRRVCPLLTWGRDDADELSLLPFVLNLNCTAAYRESPPMPTRIPFAVDPLTARYEETVLGKVWLGQSMVQRAVLRLYGSSEAVLRVRFNSLAVLFMTVSTVLTAVGNVYQVHRAIRSTPVSELQRKFGGGAFTTRFPFLQALSRLLPLLAITLLANVWFVTSQEDVFRRHPRLFCWTVGLLYTKLAIHLMLAHLCSAEYRPLRRTLAPFLLFGVHIALTYLHNVSQLRRQKKLHSGYGGGSSSSNSTGGGVGTQAALRQAPTSPLYTVSGSALSGGGTGLNYSTARITASATYADYAYDLDEELILYEFFALSVITFVHLVWNVVREVATVLEVPVFVVPRAKQEALRATIEAERQAVRLDKQRKSQ